MRGTRLALLALLAAGGAELRPAATSGRISALPGDRLTVWVGTGSGGTPPFSA